MLIYPMDQLWTKCELHIPAKEPHSAAWPDRRSKHVETNNDNDDDANTGECELCTCRYQVAIVDNTVIMIRVGSSG